MNSRIRVRHFLIQEIVHHAVPLQRPLSLKLLGHDHQAEMRFSRVLSVTHGGVPAVQMTLIHDLQHSRAQPGSEFPLDGLGEGP